MATLIEYLAELADTNRAITIPCDEVARLVNRFGVRVRQMGSWNVSGDGSLKIPLTVIREAAAHLDSHDLIAAVEELKADRFTDLLQSPASIHLIEKISENYSRYFHDLMSRYQETDDPAETAELSDRLVKEVFGSPCQE